MPSGLVVGAEGLIGKALFAALQDAGWKMLGTTRQVSARKDLVRYDLAESPDGILKYIKLQNFLADGQVTAFLLAAATGYERCKKDPDGTRLINVDRTVELASRLMQSDVFLVFPSSSAVFAESRAEAPGEASARAPVTEYGRQKAAAERAIEELSQSAPAIAGAAIVRISKVVHAGGRFGKWMHDLVRGKSVEAARDLLLAPVSMGYVAQGMRRIGERRERGVYHLSCARNVSYYEFARMLADALGCNPALVRGVDVRASLDAGISGSGHLRMGEFSRRAGLEPQPLETAVAEVIREFKETL
jgi:dTDP-4-dehydrorhamnose reductase